MGLGVVTGMVIANQGVVLLARMNGAAGVPVTQASLASIAYAVSDLTAGVSLGTGAFAVAASIFDSLQTDSRWTRDAVGYNFASVLPASLLPVSPLAAGGCPPAPHRVQVDVTFTPVAGQPVRAIFAFSPIPVFG